MPRVQPVLTGVGEPTDPHPWGEGLGLGWVGWVTGTQYSKG